MSDALGGNANDPRNPHSQPTAEQLLASTGSPGSIADFAGLVPRYKQLREAGLRLNNKMVKSLRPAELREGATNLNMYKSGAITLETEDHTAVLMDFCLHDVWQCGRNVVQRYYAETPPPADSDEMKILRAKIDSFYSVFVIENAEPGAGIDVRDVLGGEHYPVMDVNFGNTARAGLVIAMRLMCVDGIWTSTGASIPAGANILQRIATGIKKLLGPDETLDGLSPQRRSDVTALIIRCCVAGGAMSHVAYSDPDSPSPAGPNALGGPGNRTYFAAPKIGRNDPCPCGSGRKYKKCCGHGRF